MSGAKVPGDFMPPVKQASVGWPYDGQLVYAGAGLTTATNTLDSFVVSPALAADRRGINAVLASAQVSIQDAGSGATSGNWTFTLTRSGVTLATLQVAYNALQGNSFDLRTDDAGIALYAGDVIVLNLTGVPSGTLSGGITSMRVGLCMNCFGVKAH